MFKDAVQYTFELDGASYCLSGNILEQVPDFKDIEGTKWLISDMSESVSQFITVNAPINNAEFVVRQQLQESGEFEGPVTIISHFN